MSIPKKFIIYPVTTAKMPSPKAAHIMKSEFSEGVKSNPYYLGMDRRRGNKTEQSMPSTAELKMTPTSASNSLIITSDRYEQIIDARIK